MDENKFNNLIAILAIVIVLIALVNMSTTLIRVSDFKEKLTGYATGYVNITIQSVIAVNVYNETLDWGGGVVNHTAAGFTGNSTVYTNNDASGTVNWGNFTCQTGSLADCTAMTIENAGTVNFTLNITSDLNETTLLGEYSNNTFRWNMTEKESGVCPTVSRNTTAAWDNWEDVNVTTEGGIFCHQLSFRDWEDEVYLNFLMSVDQQVSVGTKTATITLSAF